MVGTQPSTTGRNDARPSEARWNLISMGPATELTGRDTYWRRLT